LITTPRLHPAAPGKSFPGPSGLLSHSGTLAPGVSPRFADDGRIGLSMPLASPGPCPTLKRVQRVAGPPVVLSTNSNVTSLNVTVPDPYEEDGIPTFGATRLNVAPLGDFIVVER
jgi:hypothetical protein